MGLCGGCSGVYVFEPTPKPIFCSECTFFEESIRAVMGGYRVLKCLSPNNEKEVLTFEKRTYLPAGRPRDLNKNNDCNWFIRKR
jgi:hypothetical protein